MAKERGLEVRRGVAQQRWPGYFPSASAPLTFLRDKSRAPSGNRCLLDGFPGVHEGHALDSTYSSQKCAIEPLGEAGYICAMKLLLAFAVWIGMGVVLGAGILMAIKGSPWLLIAGLIGFVIAVGKIGCMSH